MENKGRQRPGAGALGWPISMPCYILAYVSSGVRASPEGHRRRVERRVQAPHRQADLPFVLLADDVGPAGELRISSLVARSALFGPVRYR